MQMNALDSINDRLSDTLLISEDEWPAALYPVRLPQLMNIWTTPEG